MKRKNSEGKEKKKENRRTDYSAQRATFKQKASIPFPQKQEKGHYRREGQYSTKSRPAKNPNRKENDTASNPKAAKQNKTNTAKQRESKNAPALVLSIHIHCVRSSTHESPSNQSNNQRHGPHEMHWPDAGTQSRAHRVGKNLEGPPTDRRDMQPCSLKKNYPFFLTLSKVSERKSDKIFHKLHSLKTTRRNPSGNIIRDILTSMQRITCTKKEERRQSKIRQRASKGGKHPRSGRRKN